MTNIPTSCRGRRATEGGVSEYDREASIMRRSWPTCRAVAPYGGGGGVTELWSKVNAWQLRNTFPPLNIVRNIKWRTTTYRHMLTCMGKTKYTVKITWLWRHRCLDRRITSRRTLPLYSPVVTICTASLTFNNSTFCPHSVFMCLMWIWEQTAIISLYNINWLVFITEI